MLISVVGVQFGRFQSTLDIAAGDWTLEHCEVRADHATALAVRGAANVSARRCGIGGFPILDPGRMAANAVSGSGRSVCTLFACTLEITVNCGARFFGFAEGRILGCFLQINNIHVSVADTATCLVRLCTLDDVEGPRRAFYKDDSDGDMPVHAGALRLGGAGALTLSRNWMQGKLIWHLASNHTREGVKSIEEQTFETPLTAHLPPRSLLLEAWEEGVWVNGSMGQPHFFGPGEEDGLDDMPDPEELEATFRDQKSPLWRKVIQLMRRRGWGNDTGCLADPDTQVCSLPFLHEVMLLVDMLSGLNFDRALTAGRKALTRSLQSTKQRRRKKMTVQTSCFFRTKNAMTLWTPNWKREIFSILQRAHMYRSVRTRLKSPLSPFPDGSDCRARGMQPAEYTRMVLGQMRMEREEVARRRAEQEQQPYLRYQDPRKAPDEGPDGPLSFRFYEEDMHRRSAAAAGRDRSSQGTQSHGAWRPAGSRTPNPYGGRTPGKSPASPADRAPRSPAPRDGPCSARATIRAWWMVSLQSWSRCTRRENSWHVPARRGGYSRDLCRRAHARTGRADSWWRWNDARHGPHAPTGNRARDDAGDDDGRAHADAWSQRPLRSRACHLPLPPFHVGLHVPELNLKRGGQATPGMDGRTPGYGGATPAAMGYGGATPAAMGYGGATPAAMGYGGATPAAMGYGGATPAAMGYGGATPAAMGYGGATPAAMGYGGATPAAMGYGGATPAAMGYGGATPAAMGYGGATPAAMGYGGATPAAMGYGGATPAAMGYGGATPAAMGYGGATPAAMGYGGATPAAMGYGGATPAAGATPGALGRGGSHAWPLGQPHARLATRHTGTRHRRRGSRPPWKTN